MWIVELALRRRYTFIVVALLIFIIGPLSVLRTPTDIFPNIDITGAEHRLVVQRMSRGGHGTPRDLSGRTRADHRR